MRGFAAAVSSLLLLGGEVSSQSVVVPNASATARGDSGINSFDPVRTYMIGLPASELAGIPPGSFINGVSFRTASPSLPSSWPPNDLTIPGYDVTIGYALPLAGWGTTFMSNFANAPLAPVVVRTGPMVIEANRFVSQTLPAPQPNPWGDFFWDFQRTFLYLGGDLALLFTHPGNPPSTPPFIDAVTTTLSTGACFYSTAYRATTGVRQTFLIISRIHYGYGVGCPGTGGMVPNLVQTNDVAGGGTVTFGIANAPPRGIAIYAVGATPASVPLPNGCTLLTNPVFSFPVPLNANGRHALTMSFVAGLTCRAHAQVFVMDSGAPGGYSTSNGVTMNVRP